MMVSLQTPVIVGIAMVLFTLVSFSWRIKVKSYLRFMTAVDVMIILPLFILVFITDEFTSMILIIAIEVIGLLYIASQYYDQIGSPYQRMFASMVRVEDNKDMNIETISNIQITGEMKRLQDKQQSFIQNMRGIIRRISNQQGAIDGYLSKLDDNAKVLETDLSDITNDIDEILQNSAIISENIEELRNQGLEFIDQTDANFNLLVELSNASDRITDQTNIIAVNAAIEAAQTNTETNFDVVADGIQSLSKRSRETTDRLYSLINSLRRSTIEEIRDINKKLDKLEGMIFSIGEKANNSSSVTHQQQNRLSEIISNTHSSKNANDEINNLTRIYNVD